MKILKNLIRGAATLAVVATLLAAPQTAHAVTAAQSTLKNVVTVSYGDGAGFTTSVTATNYVIVDLVAAAPTVSAPVDQGTTTGTSVSYAYTITSNANGSDIVTLTAASTDTNIGAPTVDFYSDLGLTTLIAGGTVTLGASDVYTNVTIAAAGTTVITVPADQTADASVNGIIAGDTVSIGGVIFTVASVTDAGGLNSVATSTITVNGNGTVAALTAGTLVEEQTVIYMAVAVGTLAGVGDGTHSIVLTVTDGANPTTDTTLTTISGPSLQVDKYSANLTTAVAGTGTGVVVNTTTYYPAGIIGKPTETIGYAIIITNTGAGDATGVIVTDPIPAYTTYVAASMVLDPYTGEGTGFVGLSDALNVDPGDLNATSTEITIYAGSGGTGSGAYAGGTGGTLPAGKVSHVTFSVTVD
ncbi:MAG: hypothetical protein Q9M22_01055 [Mariprofundaceae bacterium]|nr:hypothetical protein [Mariprofundaceae bacterium]